MSLLKFEYELKLDFSAPVKNHCFILRPQPLSNKTQRCGNLRLEIAPHTGVWKSAQRTGEVIMGRTDFVHQSFYVRASGVVESQTGEDGDEGCRSLLYPSFVTGAAEGIGALYEGLSSKSGMDLVISAMNKVHGALEYTAGATGADTTGEDALVLKKGVCQDYAHIYCALMRKCGYPTRYVAGLNYGCGATHAWNEVFVGGVWRGIDCTNDKECDDGYIKFAHGADAEDCALNRGVFRAANGEAVTQTQTVFANVTYA